MDESVLRLLVQPLFPGARAGAAGRISGRRESPPLTMETTDALARLTSLVKRGLLSVAASRALFERLGALLQTNLEFDVAPLRTEQSQLILYISLLGRIGQDANSNGNEGAAEAVCRKLASIASNPVGWVDAFESGFVSAAFHEMVSLECKRATAQRPLVGSTMVELLGRVTYNITTTSGGGDYQLALFVIANVLLNVVADCQVAFSWAAPDAERVQIAAQALVNFAMAMSRSRTRSELTSSALRACARLVSPPTAVGMVEMASGILAANSQELNIQRDAILLVAACGAVDSTHVSSGIQQGLKFLNLLPTFSADEREMLAVVDVVRSLRDCNPQTTSQVFAAPLSRACLHAHLHGNQHDSAELQALNALVFDLSTDELRATSFEDSKCKWLVISCLEHCNELLNEHDVIANSIQQLKVSAATRGCLARLLPLVGSACTRVASPELSSTVYFSLVELLTHSAASAFADQIVAQIVAVAVSSCTGSPSSAATSSSSASCSLADSAEELFCCTISRSLGGDALLFKSTHLVLGAMCRGMTVLAQHRQLFQHHHLTRMRHKLAAVFGQVVSDLYNTSVAGQSLEGKRERGVALGHLLAPLAATFPAQGAEGSDPPLSPASLERFWYSLVVFRLQERAVWNSFPDWLCAYHLIATRCPPLLLGGFVVDKELDLREAALAPVWVRVASFPTRNLSLTQIVSGVTCQFFESLRVAGSLDFRPTMAYLLTDGIESIAPWMGSLAEHVFGVWIEAACTQLHGTSRGSIINARAVVVQMFEFIVGHCADANGLVRKAALRFAKQSLARIPWLACTPSALFTLLDKIQAISEQAARGSAFLAEAPTSEGTSALPSNMPRDRLPQTGSALSESAYGLLALAQGWLAVAARTMPNELDTVLHEYLLLSRTQSNPAHAGVGIASALISSSSSLSSQELARLTESLVSGTCNNSPSYSAAFMADLATKSLYLGELRGVAPSSRRLLTMAEELCAEMTGSTTTTKEHLVPCIYRSFALMYSLAAEEEKEEPDEEVGSGGGGRGEFMENTLYRLLHTVSSCAVIHTSKEVLDGLILGWRWLALSFPRLRNRVMAESLDTLRWTCSHLDSMHDGWIIFVDRMVVGFGDHEGVAFTSLERIFPILMDGASTAAAGSGATRFRLLSLGLHVLRAAAETAMGPSIDRRRALRERILGCALGYFSSCAPEPGTAFAAASNDLCVLSAFLSDVMLDAETWVVEYDATDEYRAAGQEGATLYLQQSTGFYCSGNGEQVAIDVPAHSAQRVLGVAVDDDRSGTLLLLQMLLLSEMNRLTAWLGETSSCKHSRSLRDLSTVANYKIALKAAWCIHPANAFVLADRFPMLQRRDGRRKGFSHLSLFLASAAPNENLWAAAPILADAIMKLNTHSASLRSLASADLKSKFLCCHTAPAHTAITMLCRLKGSEEDARFSSQPVSKEIMRYAIRCLRAADDDTVLFFLPQLVQLLRRDDFGALRRFLKGTCRRSELLCHSLLSILQVEGGAPGSGGAIRHGYCLKLPGLDPLPGMAASLMAEIRLVLEPEEVETLDKGDMFWAQVCDISKQLGLCSDRSKHAGIIADKVNNSITLPVQGVYLPTAPERLAISIDKESGVPMASATKNPFRLTFRTQPSQRSRPACGNLKNSSHVEEKSSSRRRSQGRLPITGPIRGPSPEKGVRLVAAPAAAAVELSLIDDGDGDGDPGSGETSMVIFKMRDDVRQDALCVQVARLLKDEFTALGLDVFLVTFSVVPVCNGGICGGIIEVLSATSRHAIGKQQGAKTLLAHFTTTFGMPGSPAFNNAVAAFASSLAGSAVFTYLLSIKDRNNGNVLVDNRGHIIHIDFGFCLGISPGGNLGFECAAFKYTGEMVELLQAGSSEALFERLCVQGFLAARRAMDQIIAVVAGHCDSPLGCFRYKPDNLHALRARFVPNLLDEDAAAFFAQCIKSSKRAGTTHLFDVVQGVQQNIFY